MESFPFEHPKYVNTAYAINGGVCGDATPRPLQTADFNQIMRGGISFS